MPDNLPNYHKAHHLYSVNIEAVQICDLSRVHQAAKPRLRQVQSSDQNPILQTTVGSRGLKGTSYNLLSASSTTLIPPRSKAVGRKFKVEVVVLQSPPNAPPITPNYTHITSRPSTNTIPPALPHSWSSTQTLLPIESLPY